MNISGFFKITIPLERNLFQDLLDSIEFASITKGRIGNHLVKMDGKGVPIVRTTTKYNIQAYHFSPIHNYVVNCINNAITNNALENIPKQHFNNALIEVYDSNYSKMKFHSDQSLDLVNDSYIGLFTCYERPDELSEHNIRKLVIKDKTTNEQSEYALTHNSLILFSLETNKKFQHKIILNVEPKSKILPKENKWLGITFRESKTYIQFQKHLPYFSNGEQLKIATKEQEAEFYKLRGQENRIIDFIYPNLTYTLSLADTLTPKNFTNSI